MKNKKPVNTEEAFKSLMADVYTGKVDPSDDTIEVIVDDKPVKAVKSLFEPDGFKLNKEGLKAQAMIETSIERVYTYWLDRGYSPSEVREMLFTQVLTTSAFVNAMRS